MSRRRYISTDISIDTAVNTLAIKSDFAALLYTWMIPHCGDDATIRGDAGKIMFMVMPGRRDKTIEEFEAALALIEESGLIVWDRDEKTVNYPSPAFYKHQSYIKDGNRRGAKSTANTRNPEPDAENSENPRKSAQNAVSLSSSLTVLSSSSVPPPSSETREETPKPPRVRRVDVESPEFIAFYAEFPRHQSRNDAWRAWKKLNPDESLIYEIMSGLRALIPEYRSRPPDKVPLPSTFLNSGRWRDTPIPVSINQRFDPRSITADHAGEDREYLRRGLPPVWGSKQGGVDHL